MPSFGLFEIITHGFLPVLIGHFADFCLDPFERVPANPVFRFAFFDVDQRMDDLQLVADPVMNFPDQGVLLFRSLGNETLQLLLCRAGDGRSRICGRIKMNAIAVATDAAAVSTPMMACNFR